jgi:hypothetical protein
MNQLKEIAKALASGAFGLGLVAAFYLGTGYFVARILNHVLWHDTLTSNQLFHIMLGWPDWIWRTL